MDQDSNNPIEPGTPAAYPDLSAPMIDAQPETVYTDPVSQDMPATDQIPVMDQSLVSEAPVMPDAPVMSDAPIMPQPEQAAPEMFPGAAAPFAMPQSPQPISDVLSQTPPTDVTQPVQPVQVVQPGTFATPPQGPANPGATLNMPAGKPNKNMFIAIAAGVGALLITGIIILIVTLVGGGGKINSMSEFIDAMKNMKAVNCNMTFTGMEGIMSMIDGQTITIQTDDGWNKVHMAVPSMMNMNVVAIKEGDKYTEYVWGAGQGQKSTMSLSELQSSTGNMANEEQLQKYMDKIKLDCKPNNQADFSIPSDINFKEQPKSKYEP
ncbi:hypothetical protein FWF74_03015 [Candidatus Saccharibacteria bacterium]|nr:hypothetical protein [Candidatus Saccharibacteria bacterium]MCL1962935.1 hypothetical protein [Candidatus Saccharibacteria bacterium]